MTSYEEFVHLETMFSKPILTVLHHYGAHAHELLEQTLLGSLSKATKEAEDTIDERIEMIFCFAGSQLYVIEMLVGPNFLKDLAPERGRCISGKEQSAWKEPQRSDCSHR